MKHSDSSIFFHVFEFGMHNYIACHDILLTSIFVNKK